MTKYKVYLKGGTVLEIEAGAVSSNEKFVHFYEKAQAGASAIGSFSVSEIYGFYKSDQVHQASETVRSITYEK